MKIDISNFRIWMKDPVTVELFRVLKEVRNHVELGMTDASNISATDCHLRLTKLLGIREGLDLVLEITCEDLDNGDDVDEKTD